MHKKSSFFLVFFYEGFALWDIDITSFLPYTIPKPQYIVLLCQLILYFVETKDKMMEGEHEQ